MNIRFKVNYQGSELEVEIDKINRWDFTGVLNEIDFIRRSVNEFEGEKIAAMAAAGEKKIDDYFKPKGQKEVGLDELVQTSIRKWHETYDLIRDSQITTFMTPGEIADFHQRNTINFARAMIRLGVPEEKVTLNLDS